MKKFLLSVFFITLFGGGNAQELMTKIKDAGVADLINLPAVVTLNDGNKIVGTITKVSLSQGLLTNVAMKLQDGSVQKYKPSEIDLLKIRCSNPTMFTVVDSLGHPIKKVIYTQFVFDHPYRSETKVKPEMRQLLNPGFDSKVKVFHDPTDNQSRSISIKGEPLVNELSNAYFVVKGGAIFDVKETTYRKDFEKLFGDCQAMKQVVHVDEITFSGLASHALLYDYYCSEVNK